MVKSSNLWEDVSFILRSPNRKKVLERLGEPIIPTQLSKQLKLDRGYVSAILGDLTKRKLAKCLTPGEVRYRLFKRTKRGDIILEKIKVKPPHS